jgi:hypothetical protein
VAATDLLVLIIRDSGLRSTLIGRLSLAGESLVTFDGEIDDPALARAVRRPAILITDAVAPSSPLLAPGEEDRWKGIIVLSEEPEGRNDAAPVRVIDKRHAIAGVPALLADWRVG